MLLPLFQSDANIRTKRTENNEKTGKKQENEEEDIKKDQEPTKYLIYNPMQDNIKVTTKSQAELNEILPNLKRIIFADYLLKEEKLKEFLIVTEPWLRSHHIELYFPKIDPKDIRNLLASGEDEKSNYHSQNSNHNTNTQANHDSDNKNDNNQELAEENEDAEEDQDNNAQDDDIDTRTAPTKRSKNKKQNSNEVGFEWWRWKDHFKPVRLSVHRWKESPHYLLYLRATAWKMWWLRDIQFRHEVYLNLVH
ncbi:non-SMC condensin II complex, subunit D3 [Reticulomyxa filosa]|uniref:Non-SMC condensin II complex, subunit D3 n=1 Tax=Reticulomyxa filosa TaxID=46433 RepID=X6MVA1_RETFI|nr:non-SMC condensin II complex, subunit D3 [Reticulomyxa filosa]|eukprot:ETO17903.1 non-SMC condensin II complex, subunit D3 [Reticulomyxa filosa]